MSKEWMPVYPCKGCENSINYMDCKIAGCDLWIYYKHDLSSLRKLLKYLIAISQDINGHISVTKFTFESMLSQLEASNEQ